MRTCISCNHTIDQDESHCHNPKCPRPKIRADANPRPIETAPKDGTRLLLFYEGVWVAASWWKSQEQWMDDDFNYSLSRSELTHWLPMPPDPTT